MPATNFEPTQSANGLRPPIEQATTNASGTSSITLFTLPNTSPDFNLNGAEASLPELDGIEGHPLLLAETLNSQLEVENRIKEGAENLLKMDLVGSLRLQVETELEAAKQKIEAITRQIDMSNTRAKGKKQGAGGQTRKFAGQGPPPSGVKSRADSEERDDFRTALQQASSCITTLWSLSRPAASPSLSPGLTSPGISPPTNPDDVDRSRIETMARLATILQRNLRVRYEISIADLVKAVLPALSDRCSKRCRAWAYRLIRHALVDADSVMQLCEQPLDWYIVKSLSRDNKHSVEKEQVIKLIRAIIELKWERRDLPKTSDSARASVISEPIMRALIAVAEHTEDPFRPICVQTLAEITLIDIALVAKTGGIRFLLHALSEGPSEMGHILMPAFLYILDSPKTRAYLRVGSDLEIAFSPVTDAYGKGPEHADRIRGASRMIQTMLRTWSGLMYCCMNNMLAIRSLIDTLRIPSLQTREIILDMFFDLLNIKTPEWYKTFIAGRRLTMYGRSRQAGDSQPEPVAQERSQENLKLTDQYIALLLLLLTDAGLLDALTAMLEESTSGSTLSRKATLLMAEVLQMSNRVLPLPLAAKIQAVPRAFNLASDYSHGENRIVGALAFSAIDSFNRNQARLQPVPSSVRPRANSSEDAVRRGQRQVEQVKLRVGMSMDDRTFQSSLLETQVMLTKDHTKWNFETLQELIEGPLLNPKRMEEAIKGTRFIRRLMSFYYPFNHRFSDMPRVKSNQRWVRLGCALLMTLLSSPDGLRFLSTEDDFLKQIVRGFAQLDPFNGTQDSDPIFSKERVSDTLTYGYFEMLGTLSKHKDGMELMEKLNFFTAFYHLSELRSREDLIKGIIENLDYNIDGHPRIVLSKALTSSYKHVRLYATNYLGELIRTSSNANAWTLRLLLTQLYDPAADVCERAVRFLEEACEDKNVLQLVVEMQPTMDHLGEIGHPLLLKFMSTPIGFRYLYDAGYIDREMDMWFHERNIFYVVQVEVFLAQMFVQGSADDYDNVLEFDGTVPPHFYGEMSKTDLGCQVLSEKGHFAEFSHFIRQHGLEEHDPDLILKLKSILWAVGNVGATEGGLPFLEEEDIIPAILGIAENSPLPSVRGTCFFVIGLISSTTQGAEILGDLRWEATLSPLGLPTGLCIPTDVEKFLSLPPCKTLEEQEGSPESELVPPTTQEEIEVINAIQNLANTVIANAASRLLAKMKTKSEYRPVFSSRAIFFRALHAISTQRYRLPVRRYILDLFTIELDPEVVASLEGYSRTLRAPIVTKLRKSPSARVVSIFGLLGPSRRASDSDEDELDADEQSDATVEHPAIRLQPVNRITGFAA